MVPGSRIGGVPGGGVGVVRSGVDRPAISTGPALMIPAGYPRDLPSALLRAARDFGGAGVVEIGPDGRETKLDFPTLLELAARILAGLRANGVRAGDPAVVHCTEPVGFFASFWACTLGGIRPLLMAPSADGDRTEEGRERLRKVTDLLGWTVLIGRPSDLPNDLGLPVLDPDALAGHEPTSEFHRPAADDVAVLMMSSGTSTGKPKIVQLTHRGLVEFAAGTPAMLPVRPGQTTLNWLPLDQSGAFLLYHLLPVFTGCTNIHVNTRWVLDNPLRWLDLMDQHRVNHSWAPNFGYRLATQAIAGEPDRHWDLSALRSLVSGGEQITVPVMSEFLRLTNRFGVVPETFVAAWGMTETVTGITFARPGLTPNVHRIRIPPTGVIEWVDQRPSTGKVAVARPGKARTEAPDVLSLVSVGAPAPGTTVRIVAPNGAVLPEGRIGHLQVASARVTPGYLGNLDADRAAFPIGNWPARKWLATGDQGFITGGQVVITGRDSERVIMSGKLYYAHDIETVASSVVGAEHGLIAACGVADAETGTDRLVVFYALTPESIPGMDQAIRSLIQGRLGLQAEVVGVPRRDFPTTPGGKILRPLLRQRWIDGTLQPPPNPHVEPAGATPHSGPTGQGPHAAPADLKELPTSPVVVEAREDPANPHAEAEDNRPAPLADPEENRPTPLAGQEENRAAVLAEAEEDPAERTMELPVVRLAWKRTLQQSIPTPPQRPTLGTYPAPAAPADPEVAQAPAGEPTAASERPSAADPEPASASHTSPVEPEPAARPEADQASTAVPIAAGDQASDPGTDQASAVDSETDPAPATEPTPAAEPEAGQASIADPPPPVEPTSVGSASAAVERTQARADESDRDDESDAYFNSTAFSRQLDHATPPPADPDATTLLPRITSTTPDPRTPTPTPADPPATPQAPTATIHPASAVEPTSAPEPNAPRATEAEAARLANPTRTSKPGHEAPQATHPEPPTEHLAEPSAQTAQPLEHPAPEPNATLKPESPTKLDGATKPESAPNRATTPDAETPKPDVTTETESVPEPGVATETESAPEPEADLDAESVADPEATEAETAHELEATESESASPDARTAQAGSNANVVPTDEPAEPEPTPEPERTSEIGDSTTQPAAKAVAAAAQPDERQPNAEHEAAEYDAGTAGTEVTTEAEPRSEPAATLGAESVPEPEATTGVESVPETEASIGVDSAPESGAKTEPGSISPDARTAQAGSDSNAVPTDEVAEPEQTAEVDSTTEPAGDPAAEIAEPDGPQPDAEYDAATAEYDAATAEHEAGTAEPELAPTSGATAESEAVSAEAEVRTDQAGSDAIAVPTDEVAEPEQTAESEQPGEVGQTAAGESGTEQSDASGESEAEVAEVVGSDAAEPEQASASEQVAGAAGESGAGQFDAEGGPEVEVAEVIGSAPAGPEQELASERAAEGGQTAAGELSTGQSDAAGGSEAEVAEVVGADAAGPEQESASEEADEPGRKGAGAQVSEQAVELGQTAGGELASERVGDATAGAAAEVAGVVESSATAEHEPPTEGEPASGQELASGPEEAPAEAESGVSESGASVVRAEEAAEAAQLEPTAEDAGAAGRAAAGESGSEQVVEAAAGTEAGVGGLTAPGESSAEQVDAAAGSEAGVGGFVGSEGGAEEAGSGAGVVRAEVVAQDAEREASAEHQVTAGGEGVGGGAGSAGLGLEARAESEGAGGGVVEGDGTAEREASAEHQVTAGGEGVGGGAGSAGLGLEARAESEGAGGGVVEGDGTVEQELTSERELASEEGVASGRGLSGGVEVVAGVVARADEGGAGVGEFVGEVARSAEGDGAAVGAGVVPGAVAAGVEQASKGRAAVVEPVAVVGVAGRFPGAETLEQFWDNLVGGVESIRRYTPDEVSQAGGHPDGGLVAVNGALEQVESFDAKFFGLSDREAELMDPAQRLFLEVCYQALEHGGYAGTASRVGIFAGSGMNLYTQQHQSRDSLATRVAYRLGLTGPAIGVQSAWSSSLVAVHLACQALRSGDADLALAGAAAVQVPQATGYHPAPESILSPSGQVRAFDAAADGTVGGNGVAAVLLKRLDQAVADGDTVYAVIRGTAVSNEDAPAGNQVELIERALERAGFAPDSLSYIEANAIGSATADSAEVKALTTALRRHTDKVGFCTIGSVKPNIGHLDSAAGMAGLIKTILMLQHRTLVPTINYTEPNPELGLDGSPFVIGTEVREWTVPKGSGGTTLRAGVSALDAGGTNAQVILEEAPRQIRRGDDGPVVLPLSAPDLDALADLVELYRTDLGHGTGHRLIDLAGTAALGRPAYRYRIAVAGSSEAELVDALGTAQAAEVPRGGPGPLGYAFTGQGAARRGMAAGLAARFPVFRSVLDECDRVYAEETGGSLLELLLTPAGSSEGVWPTETAQPALFAFELALARLWQSFGVQPALVVGHSVGEYAALCVAGALSLPDGVRLTAKRGELMQRGTVPGAMVAVRADADRVRELAQTPGVEIAAGNGPQSFVLTGSEVIVGQLAAQLDRLEVAWQRLDVDRAFHSSLVDPILADFAAIVREITLKPLRTPMVSSWSGELLESGTVLDGDYLVGQLRQPVLFGDAVEAVTAAGCRRFLELGPDAVLSPAGRRIAPNSTWIPAQRLGQDPVLATMNGLAELYEQGTEIAWSKVYGDGGRVPLPTYPFRRVHHPIDPSATVAGLAAEDAAAGRASAFERAARAQAAAFEPVSGTGPAVKRIPLDLPTEPDPAEVSASDEAEAGSPFALPAETHQVDADYLLQAGSLVGDEVSAELYRESLDAVLDLTCEKLSLDPYDLTVDHTFAELGADAASMAPVIEEINARFEVELTAEDLFATHTTPHKLATAVAVQAPKPEEPAVEESAAASASASDVDVAEGIESVTVVEDVGAEVPAVLELTEPVRDPRAALAVLGSGLAELAAKVDEAAEATSEAELPGSGMAALMSQQLRVAGQLVDGVTKLMREQLILLNERTPEPTDAGQVDTGAADDVDRAEVDAAAVGAGVGANTPEDAGDVPAAAEQAAEATAGSKPSAVADSGGEPSAEATSAARSPGEASGGELAGDVISADEQRAEVVGAGLGLGEGVVLEDGEAEGLREAREVQRREFEYWSLALAGAEPLVLPGDRPAGEPGVGSVKEELAAELGDAVFVFSRERRVSPLMVMLAAVGTVLGRFAAQDDVTIGTAMIRPKGDTSTTTLRALPIRIDLSGEPDLGELAHRVRDVTTGAFDHAGTDLAVLERDPLFQILVEFEDGDEELPEHVDVRVRLTHHGAGITCTADYRTDLFEQSTIDRLLGYLEAVLRRATSRPHLRLPDLMLPIESDLETLRELEGDIDPVGLIGRVRRNAVVAGELSGLHTLFEQQVARTPDAIAVIQDDRQLTYAELDRRSNAVAWQLVDLGVKPGQLIAVRVARGTELVVAVLAVLKSGAAYLPLDPGVPESRWAFMVEDASAVALVGDDAALADRLGLRLVPVAAGDGDLRSQQAPPVRSAADDVAYCIYTSGSTGNPKGVLVPHRGPVNLVRHYLRTRSSLRTLQWTSFGFDVHVQELFTALASGASLVLIGEDDRYDPDAVIAALRDHRVERLFMAFSPLTALLATMRRLPELPALREIVAGGEAMVLTHKVRDFLEVHPDCRLFNEYGPAEASIVTTIHEVDAAEDRPSIGRPVEGVVVRLLDAALRPVPVGAVGEIHLGGAAVAQGYIGRPEETERAFVPDPGHPGGRLYRSRDLGRWRADGTLEYLGRADDQVKIRGHRVEPGETEHVLADQPGVVDAVVVACADPGGDTCLLGYVVLEDSDPAVLARLMLDLGKELPIYLVPADLIPIEELPLDDNGRLDRSRLPEPEWLKP